MLMLWDMNSCSQRDWDVEHKDFIHFVGFVYLVEKPETNLLSYVAGCHMLVLKVVRTKKRGGIYRTNQSYIIITDHIFS